jgi:tetratricopeptide (TPR) repeat protein
VLRGVFGKWKDINTNLLMGFIYEAMGRPGMSRKHFAIAKVSRMRELGQLQPFNYDNKNFRTQSIEYRVEIIDYGKVLTKDQEMKPTDSDEMHFGLIDQLMELTLYSMADIVLKAIIDKHSIRYLLTCSKIRIYQKRYSEATTALDELLSKQKDHIEAWVLRGHAYFFNENLFDSEESYIRALRLNPDLNDHIL